MRPSLDKRFAVFLRQKRGDLSLSEFARKLGISKSTLFRLENGEQSPTLKGVEKMLERLKCDITDAFTKKD